MMSGVLGRVLVLAFLVWGLGAGQVQAGEAPPGHPVVANLSYTYKEGLHFFYPPRYEAELARLIEASPRYKSVITADLRPEVLDDIPVYLLPDLGDYFRAQGRPVRAPDWAGGLALLDEEVILVRIVPRGASRLELDRTLAHEMSHIALRRAMGSRAIPAWLYEGFALLTTEVWGLRRAEPLAQAGLANHIIPLAELDASFPKNAARAQLAYAQSGHFVRWLIVEHGRPAFRTWLRLLGEGQPVEAAFVSAFGESLADAELRWREGLVVEHGWLSTVAAGTTLFFVMGVAFVGIAWGVRRRRRRALARMSPVDEDVPGHLRAFGPFQ